MISRLVEQFYGLIDFDGIKRKLIRNYFISLGFGLLIGLS